VASGTTCVNGVHERRLRGWRVKPVLAWFRLDLRSRWRSLLVLALLVAFASGTVMAAVAGARRGASAPSRLHSSALPTSVVVLPNTPGFDWEPIRALPNVAALTTFVVGDLFRVDGVEAEDSLGFAPADDEMMRTIERPHLIDGRVPDPTRADEVVVSPDFVAHYGLGVGDAVTIRLYRPETVDALAGAESAPDEADGPVVEARIVGVVRSPWLSDQAGGTGGLQVSPGLYANYRENLVGAQNLVFINAMVRLHGGEAAIPAFKEDLARVTGRTDIDVWNMYEALRHQEGVTGFEANALFAFALAAGVAAVFLVGQSMARYSNATVAELHVLRAMGMTPGQTRLAAVAGPTLAAFAGVLLGAAAAVVGSRWFPIGTATGLEPVPGFDADWMVLIGGLIGIPVLAAAGALASASSALRPPRAVAARRGSGVAAAAAQAGAPVPVVVGARFALEPGRGRQAVPVRPALLGAVIGVLGIVAAFTFSSGVSDAAANPARFGQVFELQGWIGIAGSDLGAADALLPRIAEDPDVIAVNKTRSDVAESEGAAVAVFSFEPIGTAITTVLTRGAMPSGPDEIALAPLAADIMGVDLGDTIEVDGTRSSQALTVTGLAFVPQHPHNDYASGAWVTGEGYDDLFSSFKFATVEIALRDGAEPEMVAGRLLDAAAAVPDAEGFEIGPPEPVTALAELQQVRRFPLVLAAFLAVLALGAVGHAVATAVRRRRHDVAVLRALGLTRPQCRTLVVTQASLLAMIGLLIGVPVGLAVGRLVWRYVADTTPLYYVAPVAWLALVLIAPVALVAANLLAVRPARTAASLPVGQVLRVE
jgi:hypothetical protein